MSVSEESEAKAASGLNKRKLLWGELNQVLIPIMDSAHTTGAVRLVRMLDKVSVVRKTQGLPSWARLGHILWDRGAGGSTFFPTLEILFESVGRYHKETFTEVHVAQLRERGVTYWAPACSSRGFLTGVFYSLVMDAEVAGRVNAARVLCGSEWGNWSEDGLEEPAFLAQGGDVLCMQTWKHSRTPDMCGVPYNQARWYPRAFFEEQARYIDTLY